MAQPNPTVAILGAGAWGTAMAVHLASRAHAKVRVRLWARSAQQVRSMARSRENSMYLRGVPIPAAIEITGNLRQAARADVLIVATPVLALVNLVTQLVDAGASAPLAWLSKGFVETPSSWTLPHRALAPLWPNDVAVVSGPTFAGEVAMGLPAAVAVAATSPALAGRIAALIRGDALRAYESDDLAGVETGGAVKNVLAIAAGASDGLGFGHNARAALITRGLAEVARLSHALGGRRETLMGLAGLGDLVLTCTGDASRNRRVGLALAQGRPLDRILAELGHVAEGVLASRAVHSLAHERGVEMPICEAVHRVVHEGVPVRDAVVELLRREPRAEFH